MKTAALFYPASAAAAVALLTASCDRSSQNEARQASARAEEVAAETGEKAAAAGNELKQKAGVAMEAGKELGASALESMKNMGSKAVDYARENLNKPEVDAVLNDFRGVLTDAKQAAEDGISPEKREELKARWKAAHTRIQEQTPDLSPEVKRRLQGIVSSLERNWNQLMDKAEEKNRETPVAE